MAVKAENWPVAEYSHDFRVGGRESGRCSRDGKTFYLNETVYLDIVENRRISRPIRWRRAISGFPLRSLPSTSCPRGPAPTSCSPDRLPFWTGSTRSNIAATAGNT